MAIIKKFETKEWFLNAKIRIYCCRAVFSGSEYEKEWYVRWAYVNKVNPDTKGVMVSKFYEDHVKTYDILDKFD